MSRAWTGWLLAATGTLALSGMTPSPSSDDVPPIRRETRTDRYGDPLPPGAIARLGTIRLRPGGWYQQAAFMADGKTFITASQHDQVQCWDLTTGKLVDRLAKNEKGVQAVALSPDAKTLALGGRNGIILWNVDKHDSTRRLPSGPTVSLAFTPDGQCLISGGADYNSAIRVWDLATGKERRRMKWHREEVSDVLAAPDNRTVVSVSRYPGLIHIADWTTGEEIHAIAERNWHGLDAAAMTSDGKSVFVGGSRRLSGEPRWESFLACFDVAEGKLVRELKGHDRSITGLAMTPDGKTLVSSDSGRNVRVWDLATAKELRRWHGSAPARMITPDGKSIVGGDQTDGGIHLWDLETGKPRHDHLGHDGHVTLVAFSPDGRMLASCAFHECAARIWDLSTTRPATVVTGHESKFNNCRTVLFLADGSGVVSGGADSALRLWDPTTGQELRRFRLRGEQQVAKTIQSTDGTRLVCSSGSFDGEWSPETLTAFDVATAKEIACREEKLERPRIFEASGLSPDGKSYTRRDGQGLVIRELATGKELAKLSAPDPFEEGPVYSPDGQKLAVRSGTWDPEARPARMIAPKVRIFDVQTTRELLAIPVEDAWLQALAFSADAKRLAAVGTRKVTVYDAITGVELWRSPEVDFRIGSIAFAPDGKTLASGLYNGSILIWDITKTPPK